jgi:broad specificity phosphatase PhoE
MKNVSIAVVRHGDVARPAEVDTPLTEHGRTEMYTIRDVITQHLLKMCGRNKSGEINVKRLTMSFSFTRRALESAEILKYQEDVVVTGLFIARRQDIPDPMRIVQKILGLLSFYEANVATIVAHGDMPAVLAETLIGVTGLKVPRLYMPATGSGYLVDMGTGELVTLSQPAK